jgi:hypothetical protein
VDLITSKFDTTINHHVVPSKFTNEQHMKHTNSGVMLLLDKVDIIIMATNAIVPTPLLTDRDNPTRSENAIEQITRPFLNYTKDITIGLAIEYDLIELLSISHSCIKQSYNRCYQCYWCKEREWGFAKNNYSDPGTN